MKAKKDSIKIIKQVIKEELFKLDYRIIARKIIREYENNVNFINQNFEQFVRRYVEAYKVSKMNLDEQLLIEILKQEVEEIEQDAKKGKIY